MNQNKTSTENYNLEFKTYCVFTEEKLQFKDIIGLVFKDYLESLKIKNI